MMHEYGKKMIVASVVSGTRDGGNDFTSGGQLGFGDEGGLSSKTLVLYVIVLLALIGDGLVRTQDVLSWSP
jgi:hypothetical protein